MVQNGYDGSLTIPGPRFLALREAGEQLRAAKVTHEMQLELFAALRSGDWAVSPT